MNKLVFLFVHLFVCQFVLAETYTIGTYYYPGWKNHQLGGAYPEPWEKIKPFPAREPQLGWYAEGDPSVMQQQLGMMKQGNLDFVAFNWYWARDNRPMLAHALNAYLGLPTVHGMRFAISWANHTDYTFSREQFQRMFRFWAQRYMFRDDYLKINQKPVVFIFSASTLQANADRIGLTLNELFSVAEEIFKEEGLPGPVFFGGAGGGQMGVNYIANSGWTGFSAYNFHSGATLRFAGGRRTTHGYGELNLAYQNQWNWFARKAEGLYIVPMTSGWDRKPWGGSKDPLHDGSMSTPAEFEAHLIDAKKFIDSQPERTRRMGVICCWNEFGEGSFIEPTKHGGANHLDKVKKVFGTP